MHPLIEGKKIAIAAACRRYGVIRLALFGSGARGRDFDPATSDADLLVEFDDGYGVDEYLGLKQDLESVLGRSVDLVTRRGLSADRGGRLKANISIDGELVYER